MERELGCRSICYEVFQKLSYAHVLLQLSVAHHGMMKQRQRLRPNLAVLSCAVLSQPGILISLAEYNWLTHRLGRVSFGNVAEDETIYSS